LNPKETYKDIVIRHIYDSLMEGKYAPGEKILENTLSQELGLSRAPVREGLRELVSIGILEYRPQVGNFVATMSPEEIVDAYVTRGVLEGYASRESAERMSAAEFDALEAEAEKMRSAGARNRQRELVDIGDAFHQDLFRHCHNRQLRQQTDSLSLKLHLMFNRFWPTLYTPDEVCERHKNIVKVMRTRDPQQIEQVIRDHYSETGRRIAGLIGDGA